MIRVVIDTNVLVSGLICSSGNEAVLLFAISQGRLQPCSSDDILEEYAEVLRCPKFVFSDKEVQSLIELVQRDG